MSAAAITATVVLAFQLSQSSLLDSFDRPKGVYYTCNDQGAWVVGNHSLPLMNRKKIFVNANVERQRDAKTIVYFREFAPQYKLDTVYTFDADNKLRDMRLVIRGDDQWRGVAEMHWSGKEYGVPYATHFYDLRSGLEIGPPRCEPCRTAMEDRKVYLALTDMPFAALLPEGERLNAMQQKKMNSK